MKSLKIMIRATNWVGDAIMALPALRAIRQRHPDAAISIVARPYVADIYRDQQICDELIPYDPNGVHRGWSGREKLAADLRKPQIRHRTPPPKRLRRRLARLARPNPAAHWIRPRCPQPLAHQSHPCPQVRRNSPAREVLLSRTSPTRRLARSTHRRPTHRLASPRRRPPASHANSSRKRRKTPRRPHRRRRRGILRFRQMLATRAFRQIFKRAAFPHRRRRNSLWHSRRTPRLHRDRLRIAARPHQPHRQNLHRRSPPPSFPSATSSSATIPVPCTSPPPSASRWSPFSVPPIPMAPPRSLRASPSSSKSPIAAHASFAAAPPIIAA